MSGYTVHLTLEEADVAIAALEDYIAGDQIPASDGGTAEGLLAQIKQAIL